MRLGIGVGGNAEEHESLGEEFHARGRKCDEQLELLKTLWINSNVEFRGKYHTISRGGLDPLPIQQPIPMWIGGASVPSDPVLRRIGTHAAGWFVLCAPDQFDGLKSSIDGYALDAGRTPSEIGCKAGVAVVGPRAGEWQDRVNGWAKKGLTHLCLRTLGGGLEVTDHVPKMQIVVEQLPW